MLDYQRPGDRRNVVKPVAWRRTRCACIEDSDIKITGNAKSGGKYVQINEMLINEDGGIISSGRAATLSHKIGCTGVSLALTGKGDDGIYYDGLDEKWKISVLRIANPETRFFNLILNILTKFQSMNMIALFNFMSWLGRSDAMAIRNG